MFRILAAANETANAGRDWLLTLFFFSTGLRLAEVAQMEIGDVHFDTSIVQIRAETAKNRKECTVPLYPELADVLQTYIHAPRRGATLHEPLWITTTGRPLNREGLRGLGRTLAARSKVKHFSWHLARHTMAHTSLDLGMDLCSLRLALGHENLTETMRYAKGLSAAQLAKMPSITARPLGKPTAHDIGDGNAAGPNGSNERARVASGRPDGKKGRLSLAK